MNKAITDGITFMPLAFEYGLDVWSSGDGTPGSDTYDGSGLGVFVSADQDFGGCLEILHTGSPTKLRYMAETPILPGCYLQIKAKVKAVAGPLPSVRIAGWAGGVAGAFVGTATPSATATTLTTYGQVVEVSAIIGTGPRTGVDMVWSDALYGHIGLDITGATGGIVRIDDIEITDVTNVFVRDMMGVVDVRDYGAVGDGTTDDTAAFEAADADAGGREVLVSAGIYYLADHVTIENQIRFEGTVIMPDDKRAVFQKNFDFVTYADAFGNEELAFKKAFQALLNNADHESLDLCGRRILLTAPVDMQAAVGNKTSYAIRRAIRNGQFEPEANTSWDSDIITSNATYSASNPTTLTNVAAAANIPVGSLITGNGVGREIYVKSVNASANTVSISQPLYDAEGTQNFTFTRFKYMLDFSGFDTLSQFIVDDIEFGCGGIASGVMIGKSGITFHLKDCQVNKPKDRGLTSIDSGCQGMMIDRCQFVSNEQALDVEQRTSIGFNANANDVKIRDCRVSRFKHFCILGGTGSLITGNHWFHGDDDPAGVRKGGIIITTPNCKTAITGNYVDNNFIEWTNEHDATPALGTQYSFGGLTITGNIFTANDTASWFNWIVVKPFGPDHYIHGLTVTGNVFRTLNNNIQRVEAVDTTFADLDFSRFRNVVFMNNTFNGINDQTFSPVTISHSQASNASTWTIDTEATLPFGGYARNVTAVVADGEITDGSSQTVYDAPWSNTQQGAAKDQVQLKWSRACKGKVNVTIRVDNPT